MDDNKFVIYGVPRAIIDHIRPEDLGDQIELRPLEPLLIATPGRAGDWVNHTFKDHGRSHMQRSLDHLDVFWTASHAGAGLPGDSWLVDVPQPRVPEFEPTAPTFTFKDPVLSRFLFGPMGSRQSSFERWMDGIHNHHYGFKMREMWDHIKWLNPNDPKNSLRVVIPARRYSGLNAFELGEPHMLKQPKPSDRYSLWIVETLTQLDYSGEKYGWIHSLIQAGLDEAFAVAKRQPVRMSARPKIRR